MCVCVCVCVCVWTFLYSPWFYVRHRAAEHCSHPCVQGNAPDTKNKSTLLLLLHYINSLSDEVVIGPVFKNLNKYDNEYDPSKY